MYIECTDTKNTSQLKYLFVIANNIVPQYTQHWAQNKHLLRIDVFFTSHLFYATLGIYRTSRRLHQNLEDLLLHWIQCKTCIMWTYTNSYMIDFFLDVHLLCRWAYTSSIFSRIVIHVFLHQTRTASKSVV